METPTMVQQLKARTAPQRSRLSDALVWVDWNVNHIARLCSWNWPNGKAPISEKYCDLSTRLQARIYPEMGDEGFGPES